MKHLITMMLSLAIVGCNTRFELPKKWDKDFYISLIYGGGMDGTTTELKITYDSCSYAHLDRLQKIDLKKSFLMNETQRSTVLETMRKLNVTDITSSARKHPIPDGWSRTICFGANCVNQGASADMTKKDAAIFLTAFNYLEDFAKKGK